MIIGIVLAVGLGFIFVGAFGAMGASIELRPDRQLVTLFLAMFLVGMGMVGGGLGYAS